MQNLSFPLLPAVCRVLPAVYRCGSPSLSLSLSLSGLYPRGAIFLRGQARPPPLPLPPLAMLALQHVDARRPLRPGCGRVGKSIKARRTHAHVVIVMRAFMRAFARALARAQVYANHFSVQLSLEDASMRVSPRAAPRRDTTHTHHTPPPPRPRRLRRRVRARIRYDVDVQARALRAFPFARRAPLSAPMAPRRARRHLYAQSSPSPRMRLSATGRRERPSGRFPRAYAGARAHDRTRRISMALTLAFLRAAGSSLRASRRHRAFVTGVMTATTSCTRRLLSPSRMRAQVLLLRTPRVRLPTRLARYEPRACQVTFFCLRGRDRGPARRQLHRHHQAHAQRRYYRRFCDRGVHQWRVRWRQFA